MSGVRYREQVLVWDTPRRWAFFAEQAGVPFANALAEDYRVTPHGTHAVVEWTFAVDPRGPRQVVDRLLDATLPRIFRRAMTNLSRRLG
jgi:carbon monoxide dehydrogenase subunit G